MPDWPSMGERCASELGSPLSSPIEPYEALLPIMPSSRINREPDHRLSGLRLPKFAGVGGTMPGSACKTGRHVRYLASRSARRRARRTRK